MPSVELKAVCDFDLTALARAKRRYPALELRLRFDEILADPRIDAVVIATPAATHLPFTRGALLAGKHVLVENPLATNSADARLLIELAAKRGRILMVDHTFVYTGAVQKIKALAEANELGDLLYYDSVRISLGLVQNDTNVLWDLGAHDVSILNHLCERDPIRIWATGVKHLGSPFENIAYLSAQYTNNFIAHLHMNWLAPVKVRRTLIGGSNKMVVYDDMEKSDKLKIYSKGIGPDHDGDLRERLLTNYQNGEMYAPNIDPAEALFCLAQQFAEAIAGTRKPLTDGEAALRVVRVLEAAQRSMTEGGRPVELEPAAEPPSRSVTAATRNPGFWTHA